MSKVHALSWHGRPSPVLRCCRERNAHEPTKRREPKSIATTVVSPWPLPLLILLAPIPSPPSCVCVFVLLCRRRGRSLAVRCAAIAGRQVTAQLFFCAPSPRLHSPQSTVESGATERMKRAASQLALGLYICYPGPLAPKPYCHDPRAFEFLRDTVPPSIHSAKPHRPVLTIGFRPPLRVFFPALHASGDTAKIHMIHRQRPPDHRSGQI